VAQSEECGIQKHLGSRTQVTDPDKVTLTAGESASFGHRSIVVGQDPWQGNR
jgi:hypothetical protein